MIRAIIVAAAITAQPAVAQWNYDPAQSMATAYCAARAAGESRESANRAANNAAVQAVGGSFISALGTILSSTRQVNQRAAYIINQMCPEHNYSAPAPMNKPVVKESGEIDYSTVFR